MIRQSAPILLLIIALISGCGKFSQIQKSDNIDLKYKAAIAYYEKKEYYKASTLFEEMLPLLKGQAEAEKANFYFAYCQFYLGNYVLSEYYFKKFHDTYGRSIFAEEAYYMHCVSLYEDSPDFELDQTNTQKALLSFQQYLESYPKSKNMEDCNKLIDELTFKLEQKAYTQAKQYYLMKEYKASVVCFGNVAKDFPSSKYVEEVNFLKIDAQYNYGNISIDTKRKERYLTAVEFYITFIDKYPNSKYLPKAEETYALIQDKIAELDQLKKKKTFWEWIGLS
ncbi:MAG: outer membrane protein assembly factor BamD [Cytophagales bacterium]